MKKNFIICIVIWVVIAPFLCAGVSNWFRWGDILRNIIYITFMMMLLLYLFIFYNAALFNSKEKKFHGMSLIAISIICFIIASVVGILCIPYYNGVGLSIFGIAISILITIFNVFAVIKSQKPDQAKPFNYNEIKQQCLFINNLTLEAEILIERAETLEESALLKQVYEALRYCDPRSSDRLKDTEDKMLEEFKKLSTAIINKEKGSAASLTKELLILIRQRNARCKANK